MGEENVFTPDVGFVRSLKEAGADTMKRCYQCATCSVVCDLSADDRPFPRREMVLAQWGVKDELAKDPNVWLCHNCNDCSKYCPRGARPGDVMAVLRKNAIEGNAVPAFMGKVISEPGLVWLALLIPVVIFLVILGAAGHLNIPEGPVVFDKFFPVSLIDPIFIAVALFAVASFAISIARFWKSMNVNPFKLMAMSRFVPSIYETIKEILLHKKFDKCGANSDRKLAHRLVFYGFIGLFITTNWAVFNMYVLGWPTPYRLDNPHILEVFDGSVALIGLYYAAFKIFGNVSALALLIGAFMVFGNRMKDKGFTAKNSAYDMLFAWMILLLCVTGILSELLRLANVAILAYPVYFVHLVLVFYIIAYLPYSKLAHMVYRTTALVYAKMSKADVPD